MSAINPPYRGWSISWDYGFYRATGPNYDASYEGPEDGWVDNGEWVEARTLESLYNEIDQQIKSGRNEGATSIRP